MNLAKHMEAIFLAATVALCAASYTPEAPIANELASQSSVQGVPGVVQTVVVVGKRA